MSGGEENIEKIMDGEEVEEKEEVGGEGGPEEEQKDEFAYINQGFTSEIFKIEVRNLPKHYGVGELRKLLQKLNLDFAKVKLVKKNNPWVYICFRSTETRDEGIRVLNGMKWKGCELAASEAKPAPDPLVRKRNAAGQEGTAGKRARTIAECTTALAHLSYEEQLKQKQSEVENLLKKFSGEHWHACRSQREEIEAARREFDGLPCKLETIRGSPLISGYRNKCEFSVGKDSNGDDTVGFRLGSYNMGFVEVCPIDELKHIPDRVKMAVRLFQQFVRSSKHDVFNPEQQTGVFRQLVTRLSFTTNEIMLIVGINGKTLGDGEEAQELKKSIREFFTEKEGKILNVTSLFHQQMMKKDKDNKKDTLELLHGKPHITDEIHGLKFRISPESFFQINTPAAEVLYSSIIELGAVTKDTTVLDICCGAGTIGICFAKYCKRVLGVEIIEEAVKDAKFNAETNNIDNVEFFAGNADDFIFSLMNRPGVSDGDVLAVVDPPRAGIHVKSLTQLRNARKLNRLIYVSCKPKFVTRNWLDLMRPCSKTMKGAPFKLKKALAVDMFPHTPHMELILLFERTTIEETKE
ncbi:tRNA (uracil-5-)-methyltransferase homolog A [Lutzomyia longipalpis]|uniref:tRNA (uracil-5-)-methyltransferase homolog A n=1 Tax=Lutzomyia longipalpis TaxID=7200 RepID=UPI0024836AD5|nr:tRNA (uracil-5-)-methyltransferase homolog A [Lutzomyia longipalpis]